MSNKTTKEDDSLRRRHYSRTAVLRYDGLLMLVMQAIEQAKESGASFEDELLRSIVEEMDAREEALVPELGIETA